MNPKKIAILERNFELYWSGKQPEISDQRFDELLEELREHCPDHPLLSKLGLNTVRGVEYTHQTPMLSLNKVYEFTELQKWVKKVSRNEDEHFLVQYKFDGLAGKLVGQILATRGNGLIGENISRRKLDIQLVQGDRIIPLVAAPVQDKPLLGEIVVSNLAFEKYRNAFDREFAHPRNFVTGMINRKEELPPGVKLDFVEYRSSLQQDIQSKELLGPNASEKWNTIVEYFNEHKIYPTDGLVIKLADQEYAESLGATEHHPLGAIAFKFYGESVWSKLIAVEWNHGKGKLAPIAKISPVQIGGVTISRVTLHNAKFILDRQIMIGDDLEIERAGEVIPHVLNRKPGQVREACIPNNCPTCGVPVLYREPDLICTNPKCEGTRFEQLLKAIECFEIDGLGQTIVQHLYGLGLLNNPADVFRLTYDQLLRVPGFADGSAKKLLASIVGSKKQTPETVFASLNTPGVGKSIYSAILDKIPFVQLLAGVDLCDLANIPGIGETRAIAIKRSIHRGKPYLRDLLSLITIVEKPKTTGPKICFTGKMDRPRSYYEQQAKERGYSPVDSVTKDLTLLVISDQNWTSSKTKAAEKFGIKIITLKEWENEQ